jgi:hypothetical protein
MGESSLPRKPKKKAWVSNLHKIAVIVGALSLILGTAWALGLTMQLQGGMTMWYFIAFLSGAVAGGVVVFFVVMNNQKRMEVALKILSDELARLKGGR